MKKLVAISIMAAMLLAIGAVAMASETDWMLLFKAQSGSATLASGIGQVGTAAGATDGYESTKDAGVSLVANNAAVVVYEPTWTAANPPVFGKDAKAPIVAGESKSWDLIFFLGSSYAAPDAKLLWWNATTATQDMPTTIGGIAYKYTIEMVNDPTGTYAPGTVATLDGTLNGSSTAPLGTLSWSGNAINSLKLTADAAIQSGVKFRVTAAPVPEPSSMLALASGLVGLAGFSIRRRK